LFRAWKALGGRDPAVVAGHSLGEYSAMVAAGILDFSETVKFVRVRAQYMQEAVPHGTGAMAAVLGLDDDVVQAICKEAASDGVAEAANLNSPGQVVIAGTTEGVQRAVELAKERGAKRTVLLAMSAPSHCSLMAPAAERLNELLNTITIRPPSIPVINNVDVAAESDPTRIRDAMLRQLYNPVRWADIVRSMMSQGVTQIIECGPGAVLTGLNRRVAPEAKVSAIKDADGMRQLIRDTNGGMQ
jgi:[acyl-carrier-protein] S-malonyltransferase